MGHKALKPPIEPLSQAAWQRIEDQVFQELHQPVPTIAPARRPRLALSLAAVALMASLLALGQSWRIGAERELASANPSSSAHEPSADHSMNAAATEERGATGLKPATRLKPSEARRIVTTGDDPTEVKLGTSFVSIDNHSDVRVGGSDAEGWLVEVERGSVDCSVSSRAGRPDFVVRAGTTTVRVVGTRFGVSRLNGQVSVSVDEGRVLVSEGGRDVLLDAGQSWATSREVEKLPRPESVPHRTAPKASSVDSPRKQFELAASLESSDPNKALRLYRQLSRTSGSWGTTALYARARLLVERGRRSEGKQLLRLYLKRHPRGPNAADARVLLGK